MVEYEVSGIAGRPYLGGHLEIIKLKPGEFWLSPAKMLKWLLRVGQNFG